jgi:hypothetical protein
MMAPWWPPVRRSSPALTCTAKSEPPRVSAPPRLWIKVPYRPVITNQPRKRARARSPGSRRPGPAEARLPRPRAAVMVGMGTLAVAPVKAAERQGIDVRHSGQRGRRRRVAQAGRHPCQDACDLGGRGRARVRRGVPQLRPRAQTGRVPAFANTAPPSSVAGKGEDRPAALDRRAVAVGAGTTGASISARRPR